MDPLLLTWPEFLQLLHRYIENIGEQGRLWPIVAFVYAGIEMKSLIFRKNFEVRYKQEGDPQNMKLFLAMNKRRWISEILLCFLCGASFFSLLLTMR